MIFFFFLGHLVVVIDDEMLSGDFLRQPSRQPLHGPSSSKTGSVVLENGGVAARAERGVVIYYEDILHCGFVSSGW